MKNMRESKQSLITPEYLNKNVMDGELKIILNPFKSDKKIKFNDIEEIFKYICANINIIHTLLISVSELDHSGMICLANKFIQGFETYNIKKLELQGTVDLFMLESLIEIINNNKSLEYLELPRPRCINYRLDDNTSKALMNALENNRTLKKLYVGSAIGNLFWAIVNAKSFYTELDVWSCDSPINYRLLAQDLKQNKNLRSFCELNYTANQISIAECKMLATAIKINGNITYFSNNEIKQNSYKLPRDLFTIKPFVTDPLSTFNEFAKNSKRPRYTAFIRIDSKLYFFSRITEKIIPVNASKQQLKKFFGSMVDLGDYEIAGLPRGIKAYKLHYINNDDLDNKGEILNLYGPDYMMDPTELIIDACYFNQSGFFYDCFLPLFQLRESETTPLPPEIFYYMAKLAYDCQNALVEKRHYCKSENEFAQNFKVSQRFFKPVAESTAENREHDLASMGRKAAFGSWYY